MRSATVGPPRAPWSPGALDAGLHAVLAAYAEAAAPWREAFEDLDEDVLAEAAAEARTFDSDPVAAVDTLVRGLLLQLTDWQRAIGALGRDLAAAAQDRPLPMWAADAGRAKDVRWRQARQALLEAVARHHHGLLPDGEPGDRPW
ncbi:hypothetical protein ABTX81_37915 [Kitasatospora sp. NPDC097605]|uniref:hypothetical protein n=1 Tax=Kitasatospora sp. NPDC097605 TaxID=3157226 RepID=UPI00332CAD6E